MSATSECMVHDANCFARFERGPRAHVHGPFRLRVEGNASETISATWGLEWKDAGTWLEYECSWYWYGIRRVRVSYRRMSGCTGRTPGNDLYAPCTDLRYCFPVARDTRIVARCINMWMVQTSTPIPLRSRKPTRTTADALAYSDYIRVPGADPRQTIAPLYRAGLWGYWVLCVRYPWCWDAVQDLRAEPLPTLCLLRRIDSMEIIRSAECIRTCRNVSFVRVKGTA